MIVSEILVAPELEISNVSYSALTAKWGNLNIDADGWIVALKNEEGTVEEV